MKKSIISVILTVCLCLIPMTIYADDAQKETKSSISEEIATVLNDQIDKDEYAILGNRNLYNFTLEDFYLDGKSVIKVYTSSPWPWVHLSINDIVSKADSCPSHCEYIVFDDENVRIRVFEQKVSVSAGPYGTPNTNYINDIENIDGGTIEILGSQCTINNIYCFEGYSSYMGTAIYYCTDKGVFIKYYEYATSEGVWFAEGDFQKCGAEYFEYLTSYENNYGVDGTLTGGGNIPFLDYINSYMDDKDKTGDSKKILYWAIPLACGAVLIVGGAVTFVVLRKKRKKKDN